MTHDLAELLAHGAVLRAASREIKALGRNVLNVAALRRYARARGLKLSPMKGVRALALAGVLGGCASDPTVESALAAYDAAARQGLVAERLVRPYARLNDGAPWSQVRRVEISRD